MSKIDLGKKWDDVIAPMESIRDKTHYPTLHLDDLDDKRIAEMPDTGTLVIHYKIANRTHSESKGEKGKKHSCSVTLDITHIDPPAAKSKPKKDPDGGARKAFSDYFKDK